MCNVRLGPIRFISSVAENCIARAYSFVVLLSYGTILQPIAFRKNEIRIKLKKLMCAQLRDCIAHCAFRSNRTELDFQVDR